jgi:3-oxoadipate enol-lactonase
VAIYSEVAGEGPSLALVHEGICDGRMPDLVQRLGEIDLPTLVLVGEEDMPDMHAIADQLEREIPGARRATIAATAHVPGTERPAEFDELVLGFLEEAA